MSEAKEPSSSPSRTTPMVDAAKLKDLIERVEAATEGSSYLNEAIAEALLGVTVWKSKHGYWNVSFPSDWPYGRTDNITMPGRRADEVYDAATGEKLPKEAIPTGWSMDVDLPEFTESIDAALALVEWVRPGWMWVREHSDGHAYVRLLGPEYARHEYMGSRNRHCTGSVPADRNVALAILLALLRSIEGGERG